MSTIHENVYLSLYHVATSAYDVLQLHDLQHPHWIVSHILRGRVETRTKYEQAWATTGEVMIHPPYLPFSEYATEPGCHQWMMFDVTVVPHTDIFRRQPVSLVVPLRTADAFTETFETLRTTWSVLDGPFRSLRCFGLAMQLFNLVLESCQHQAKPARSSPVLYPQDRFLDVISFMEKHLDQKVSRDDLAALVHLHPTYFDRAFRNMYGVTPMQMLRDLRLRRARQLLESTEQSLAAIAATCGFTDATYFGRMFRLQYGQTPGQYRESVKNTITGYIPLL